MLRAKWQMLEVQWRLHGKHQQHWAGLLLPAEVLLMFHSSGQRLQPVKHAMTPSGLHVAQMDV